MDQLDGRGRRVCVIGAGIAGLVTAKVLRDDGFEVSVFERSPAIGGVWAPSRTYPGLRTNNPRETYAFSDFPYPDTADDFPSADQVRTYLAARYDSLSSADTVFEPNRAFAAISGPSDSMREVREATLNALSSRL